jgi:ABC-type uncharacterized transport system permease subunit
MSMLTIHILASYATGVVAAIVALVSSRGGAHRLAVGAMAVGLGLHTVNLVEQGLAEGHLPLYGLQEVFSFLGWAVVLYYLLVQFRYRARALAALVIPAAFSLTLVAAVAPTVPSTPDALLNDPLIFSLHAGLVLLAYAAFFVVFVASVLYVLQDREIRLKRFGAAFRLLPSLDACDSIGFRALVVGFVLLTAGLACGILWSQARHGVLLQVKPIELFAIGTWLVYLALIHYRISAGWRGRRASRLAIVGFLLVATSFAVLRFSTGFHL